MSRHAPADLAEDIIEPDLPIVDAHHHLFDRPALRYMLDDYLRDAGAGHNVVASVYVETEAFKRYDGPELERSLGEVEFANGVGAIGRSGVYGSCRVAAGIVGFADLRGGDAVAPILEQAVALAPTRFRGIRQLLIESASEAPYRFITNRPPAGLMSDPAVRRALTHLGSRGLSFDAAVLHHQLPALACLADAVPDTTIILNHAGLAIAMDADDAERKAVFASWRAGMRTIAERANVVCKIGGFGMPFWGFGFNERAHRPSSRELAEAWRPFVTESIDIFGVDRCMMESNFPADARSCGYVSLWNALKLLTASAGEAEKAALYAETANRVYRLGLAICKSSVE